MTISAEHQKLIYQIESRQKTLTASQLQAELSEIVAAGYGDRPVFMQDVRDGLTHAIPILFSLPAEDGDGEIVWLIPPHD